MGRRSIGGKGGNVDPWMKAFGMQVRAKRQELGLTQQDVATAAGYTVSMISQIESGDVLPNLDKAMQLARYLQMDMAELLQLMGFRDSGPSGEGAWWRDMFILHLPANMHTFWPVAARLEILVRTVEELGRAMRDTMPPGDSTGDADGSSPDA